MCVKKKKLERTFLFLLIIKMEEKSPEALKLALIPSNSVSPELD